MAVLLQSEQKSTVATFKGFLKKTSKVIPTVNTQRLDVHSPPLIRATSPQFINESKERSPSHNLMKAKPNSWVEIFVKCRDLIKVDDFSKTDPFCVLYVKRYGQWLEHGRTEAVSNCHFPKFIETFQMDVNSQETSRVKFSVFDTDKMSVRDLQKSRCLGSTEELRISEIISETFTEYEITSEGNQVTSYISVCPVIINNVLDRKRSIYFNIGARKISRRLFSRSPATFLEVRREISPDTYHPVYKSEIIYKDSTPHWKMFNINTQKLCSGDNNTTLLLQVWNYNAKSEQELKGSLKTNLNKLLKFSGIVKVLPLHRISSSRRFLRKKQEDLQVGHLKLYQISTEEQYSLLDYLTSGTELRCGIGIDFTLSNGEPSDPTSLHFLDGNNNQYKTVLQHLGAWMGHYSTSIKVLGFGGKIVDKTDDVDINNNNVRMKEEHKDDIEVQLITDEDYCFEFPTKEDSIDTVITTYSKIASNIQLGGPTYYTRVLQNFIANNNSAASQSIFHLVSLITDGVCNDEKDFTEYLLSIKDFPIIVVIAGVGPCSFTQTLNMIRKINQKAKRSLVNFYHHSAKNSNDIKELYASTSKAIVDYFLQNNIHPKATV